MPAETDTLVSTHRSSFQDLGGRLAAALLLGLVCCGCSESEAERALARCEAAGEAYKAARTAVEEAIAGLDPAEKAVVEATAPIVEAEAAYRQALVGEEKARKLANYFAAEAHQSEVIEEWDGDFSERERAASSAVSRLGRAVEPYRSEVESVRREIEALPSVQRAARRISRSEVPEPQHIAMARQFVLTDGIPIYRRAAERHAAEAAEIEATLDAKKAAIEEANEASEEGIMAAESQLGEAQSRLERAQSQFAADAELLGRAIDDANRAREPGGPLCSWQPAQE